MSTGVLSQSQKRLSSWLYGLAFWLILCSRLGTDNFASIDLWGKLSIPAVWFASGHFPYQDPFSFTAYGAPWTDHEWLSGFVFYAALWLGKDIGLTLLKWGMVGVMVGSIFRLAHLRNVFPLFTFLLLLLGLPILELGLIATGRPQLFTFCLLPVLILLLEWIRQKGRYAFLGWLLPFGLLWSNLHGGFLTGIGVLLFYTLGEALNRKPFWPYLVGICVFTLPSLLNPYGLDYWRYLLYAVTLPRTEISEWKGVYLWNLFYWPLKTFALLTGIGFVHSVLQKVFRRPSAFDWVLMLLLPIILYQGFSHVKHQPLFVVSAAAFLPLLFHTTEAQGLRDFFTKPWIKRATILWLPLLLVLGGVVWMGATLLTQDPLTVKVRTENTRQKHLHYSPYPVGAVAYLKTSPYRGNLLTPFSWGEFAYWELYPKFRISLDGRLEAVYPMSIFHQVETFYDGLKPGSWKIPDTLGADFILAGAKSPNLPKLLQTKQWISLYRDSHYVVIGRQSVIGTVSPVLTHATRRLYLPVSAFFQPTTFKPRFQQYVKEPFSKGKHRK